MEDWAEVRRLFHREGLTKAAIARRLGMSRTTVIRLLALGGPPRCVRDRRARSSIPSPGRSQSCSTGSPMLLPRSSSNVSVAPAMAAASASWKEHLARVRPTFLAARAFQRTSYLPGEIGQLDW